MNKLKAILIGFGLGVLANSVDIETSKPYKFTNPIGTTKEVCYFNGSNFVTETNKLDEQDMKSIISREPSVEDIEINLDILFGKKVNLLNYRKVTDKSGYSYFGRLDSKGNIHTDNGVYELNSAHDYTWYQKKIWFFTISFLTHFAKQ